MDKLVKTKLLPDQPLFGYKLPGEHRRPAPDATQIVMWPSFIERGLMLPSSNFFRGMLHFYGLTLNHLTANSVLQMLIFVHLCEAWLGVPPSINLFRYFFWVKAQPGGMRTEVVRGANFQLRQDKKKHYIPYLLKDAPKNWHAEWFYVSNPPPALEKHSGWPPKKTVVWNAAPTGE